jgi:hypothetical protein
LVLILIQDNTETYAVIIYPRVDLFVSSALIFFDEAAQMLRFQVLNSGNSTGFRYDAFGAILAEISYTRINSSTTYNTKTLPFIATGTSLLINTSLPSDYANIENVTISLVYPALDFVWSASNGTILLNPIPANPIVISSASASLSSINSTDYTHSLSFGVPTIAAPNSNALASALMNVPYVLPISLANWDNSYDPLGLVCYTDVVVTNHNFAHLSHRSLLLLITLPKECTMLPPM